AGMPGGLRRANCQPASQPASQPSSWLRLVPSLRASWSGAEASGDPLPRQVTQHITVDLSAAIAACAMVPEMRGRARGDEALAVVGTARSREAVGGLRGRSTGRGGGGYGWGMPPGLSCRGAMVAPVLAALVLGACTGGGSDVV